MCHLTRYSPNAFAGAVNLLRYLFFICSVTRSPRSFFQSTVVVRLIPNWTGRFLCSSAPLATVSGAAIPQLMLGRNGKGMDGGSFQIKMDCFPSILALCSPLLSSLSTAKIDISEVV